MKRRIFPWSNLSCGKRISMKGAQDVLVLFKKNNENKYEQFFLLKVRNSLKT